MIEEPKPSDLLGIFGRRGSGKSTLMRRLVHLHAPRVLVIDPLHEHGELGGIARDRMGIALVGIKLAMSDQVRVVYQPSGRFTEEELAEICEAAMSYARDGTLVVDEWDTVVSKIPPPEIQDYIHLGRHRDLGLWAIARRPAGVSTLLASQIRHWYVSRQHLPRDLAFFEESTGLRVDEIATLPPWHFLHVDVDSGEKELVRISEKSLDVVEYRVTIPEKVAR